MAKNTNDGDLMAMMSNGSVICQENSLMAISNVWLGDDPFSYVFPIFLIQMFIASTCTSTVKFLLESFGQTSFVSQIIGGLIAGPSFIGRIDIIKHKIFNLQNVYLYETLQSLGCMFYLFLIGVKMDLGTVKRAGKKAWVIGLSCFFLPLLLTLSVTTILGHSIGMPPKVAKSLFSAAGLISLSSFHAIACFLADLKLLNSELGRLAMSASMISGICSWISGFAAFQLEQSLHVERLYTYPWILLSALLMLLFIMFLLRPVMFWIIRNTPEDKNVKEGYIVSIFLMVLLTALLGEVLGQHYLLGPMMLGLAVPVGPPLGTAIEEKMECFITSILMPIVIVGMTGLIDVFELTLNNFVIVEFLVVSSFLGKLIGTMLPALYCRMPYLDSFLLGLIMNVQGLLDLIFWLRALSLQVINMQTYGALILSMVIVTGAISPVVRVWYDPSKRYVAYRRRTIQHSKSSIELRILACIYHDENVPPILDLLKASHPTSYNPICIYVLHLIQLQGRASPLFVAHKKSRKSSSGFNLSTRIINAFELYQNHNKSAVSVNSFTAISPYTTMHDDICTLGLQRRTTLIILPFHSQPNIASTLHLPPAIRTVNYNVLNKAPCSVGILINRGLNPTTATTVGILDRSSSYNVAVIFLGGADDREALAYGAQMGEDNNVNLTVIRFIFCMEDVGNTSKEKKLDLDAINEFKLKSYGHENIEYKEKEVTDGVEFISVIKETEKSYELLMVGRQHREESSEFLQALEQWNEYPELGVIGDLLATSNSASNGSVLVVQQHCIDKSSLLDSPRYHFGSTL